MTKASRRLFLQSLGATTTVAAFGRPDLLARVEQTTPGRHRPVGR